MSATTATRPVSFHPTNPVLRTSTKKDMSITQTYYLAHKARAKLSREAARSDHDLRLLVGHANLLDSLMLELADAEREQERWFNQSVRGANKPVDRHVQWADRIVEEAVEEEEYEDDSDSDSSDDDYYEDDDVEMINAAAPARTPLTLAKVQEEEEDDDLEEDYAQLELVRTPSHSGSPPELIDLDSDSSDDESMPPSPAEPVLQFSEKDAKAQAEQEEQESLYEQDYHVSRRTPTGLVSAISVY